MHINLLPEGFEILKYLVWIGQTFAINFKAPGTRLKGSVSQEEKSLISDHRVQQRVPHYYLRLVLAVLGDGDSLPF